MFYNLALLQYEFSWTIHVPFGGGMMPVPSLGTLADPRAFQSSQKGIVRVAGGYFSFGCQGFLGSAVALVGFRVARRATCLVSTRGKYVILKYRDVIRPYHRPGRRGGRVRNRVFFANTTCHYIQS